VIGYQSAAQRRASRIYIGTERIYGGGPACRVVWPGAMPASGKPLMLVAYRYRREHQRAVYEFKFRRTMKSDRIVATCGNPRCLDARHLRAIPAPKVPKAAKDAAAIPAAPADIS